jgi:hypothetical protein
MPPPRRVEQIPGGFKVLDATALSQHLALQPFSRISVTFSKSWS